MDDDTATFLKNLVTITFAGTWIILAIVAFFANRKMNAVAKRRWMPRAMILVAALFVFFSSMLAVLGSRDWSSLWILILVIPAVVLISYLNIKCTKFCDKCSATLYNYNWFSPMNFCSKCGDALESIKATQGDNRPE